MGYKSLRSGAACSETHILSPSSMTLDDFSTCMLWQRKGVHYDFGMPMETQMLSYAGDRLLKGVLDSKRMAGGRYMLRRSAAGASDMLRAGGFYCRHGLLDRIGDLQGEETTWDFTQLGKSLW